MFLQLLIIFIWFVVLHMKVNDLQTQIHQLKSQLQPSSSSTPRPIACPEKMVFPEKNPSSVLPPAAPPPAAKLAPAPISPNRPTQPARIATSHPQKPRSKNRWKLQQPSYFPELVDLCSFWECCLGLNTPWKIIYSAPLYAFS